MAIRDVVTLGFFGTEVAYVTLLGFTYVPGAITAGEGVRVSLPPRTIKAECGPRATLVALPRRTLKVTLRPVRT